MLPAHSTTMQRFYLDFDDGERPATRTMRARSLPTLMQPNVSATGSWRGRQRLVASWLARPRRDPGPRRRRAGAGSFHYVWSKADQEVSRIWRNKVGGDGEARLGPPIAPRSDDQTAREALGRMAIENPDRSVGLPGAFRYSEAAVLAW